MNTSLLLPALSLSILLIAMIRDIQTRRIPNHLSLIGIILTALALLVTDAGGDLWSHLLSLGIMFVITFISFNFKWIGGGDAKILTFTAFTVPVQELLTLCLWISILGGVQAIVSIALARIKKQKKSKGLPYAVAIFFGTLGFVIQKIWG